MAFKVALEGNPTSGKTELPPLIAAELERSNIHTLDAKRWDLENGFLSNMRRRFVQEEIDTTRDFIRSVTYHASNYIGAMLTSRSKDDEYEVVLMQRLPWSYLYIVESVRHGQNTEFVPSGLLYRIAQAWSGLVKPDAIVYLDCPKEVLRERFALRIDGKHRTGGDWVHHLLIEQDDSSYVRFLRDYIGGSNFYIVDSTSIPDAASEIAGLIRREAAARKIVKMPESEKTMAQKT